MFLEAGFTPYEIEKIGGGGKTMTGQKNTISIFFLLLLSTVLKKYTWE